MKKHESCLRFDGWVMVPRPGDKELSREMIVGGKMGGPALQGLAHAFNNDAAAGMHAAATSGQQGRAQPVIPAVHLAPPGTSTGMPGRWVGWLYGGVKMVLA